MRSLLESVLSSKICILWSCHAELFSVLMDTYLQNRTLANGFQFLQHFDLILVLSTNFTLEVTKLMTFTESFSKNNQNTLSSTAILSEPFLELLHTLSHVDWLKLDMWRKVSLLFNPASWFTLTSLISYIGSKLTQYEYILTQKNVLHILHQILCVLNGGKGNETICQNIVVNISENLKAKVPALDLLWYIEFCKSP